MTDVPDGLTVRTQAKPPIADPALGIRVDVAEGGRPPHRLVAIGDSLAHGFQNGAVCNTDLSFPAIIAYELGWLDRLRRPRYDGFGGMPFNVEFLLRELRRRAVPSLDRWDVLRAYIIARRFAAESKAWWERGRGSGLPPRAGIMHALGIWAWDLRDVLERTADVEAASLSPARGSWFAPMIAHSNARSALRVLDAARDASGRALTPLEAARALGDDAPGAAHGIETLIVELGANNCLGSVVSLALRWSDAGYDDLRRKDVYTVWRPEHFARELAFVATEVGRIRARRVIWCTVPHVTIAPVAKGLHGKWPQDRRYFNYYGRPWLDEASFRPRVDEHLTGAQARLIDSAIDHYNESIAEQVGRARADGLDWLVFDACALLDRLAQKRYIDDPAARPAWWTPYALPAQLHALTPVPNTHFFASDASGRTDGGLFSLDGIHPTTICYGILADELVKLMSRSGVVFFDANGDARTDPRVDFDRLLAADTLIADPPRYLSQDLRLIKWLDKAWDLFRTLLAAEVT